MVECINVTGERLRDLRTEKGWSQQEVADLIGVNKTSYSAWELGAYKRHDSNKLRRRPVEISGKYVSALARLYGVSADYILGLSDFQTIDGAALHAVTGLSDDALRVLRAYNSPTMSYHLGRDISRLIVDFGRHGSNSVVSQITRYTAVNPGETGRVLPGDGIATAGAVDVDLRALHWFGIAAACDRLRDDLTAE